MPTVESRVHECVIQDKHHDFFTGYWFESVNCTSVLYIQVSRKEYKYYAEGDTINPIPFYGYKRIDWQGKLQPTQLQGYSVVWKKECLDGDWMILSIDSTGWLEQTYHKRTVNRYEVGDTIK